MSNTPGRFDHLFTTTYNGARGWLDGLTAEQRAWFDDLCDATVAWGKEPNWSKAVEDYDSEFGPGTAPASTTLAKHLRAVLKARNGDQ